MLLRLVVVDDLVVAFGLLGLLGNIHHLVLMMIHNGIQLHRGIYREASGGHACDDARADENLRGMLVKLQQRLVAETYDGFLYAHVYSFTLKYDLGDLRNVSENIVQYSNDHGSSLGQRRAVATLVPLLMVISKIVPSSSSTLTPVSSSFTR